MRRPASFAPTLLALLALAASVSSARADGALMLGERTLQRQGEAARGYCAEDDVECRHALLRALSGYSYLPGSLALGAGLREGGAGELQVQPGLELRLSTMGAAVPGGEMRIGTLELGGWLTPAELRLRGSAVDGRALFFCRDSQRGGLHSPFFGMMTRACAPNAVVGLELAVFEVQWDPTEARMAAEWLRAGLAFELLGNGHAHSRLLRSVTLSPLVDLRSLRYGELASSGDPDQGRFGVGAGGRLAALWRSRRWELGLDARYRTDLLQLDAAAPDHQLGAELRLVHNFMLTDAIVAQLGLRGVYHWAHAPADAFGMHASTTDPHGGFVGAVLGWRHEPPAI